MKLYQPPVKRSQLLENNPFFNNSLVNGYINPTTTDVNKYAENDKMRKVANYMSANEHEGILALKPSS